MIRGIGWILSYFFSPRVHEWITASHTKTKLELDELVLIYHAYCKFLLTYLRDVPLLKLARKGHYHVKCLGTSVLVKHV